MQLIITINNHKNLGVTSPGAHRMVFFHSTIANPVGAKTKKEVIDWLRLSRMARKNG